MAPPFSTGMIKKYGDLEIEDLPGSLASAVKPTQSRGATLKTDT